MPKYNNYFNESELEKSVEGMFIIEDIIKHSSLYYIGTRMFQYMSMDSEPKESDTEMHRFFQNTDIKHLIVVISDLTRYIY